LREELILRCNSIKAIWIRRFIWVFRMCKRRRCEVSYLSNQTL